MLSETHPTPSNNESLVEFARALVRAPSVLGHEREVASCVTQRMHELRFDHVEIDEAGNAVGLLQGASEGPTILFDAHMDTVDVSPREAWQHDPFGADLVDGRIYGRGTSDMKGALAAVVQAIGTLDRSKFAGRIVVSGSVGEETVEGPALKVVMDRYNPDCVVIAEASNLDLIRAGRGRAEFTVRTVGKPSHASTPQLGVNAIHKANRVIDQIEAIERSTHPFMGSGTMCLTAVISDPYPAHSVVPSGCLATYEQRLMPGDTKERVVARLHEACTQAGAADTEIRIADAHYETYTGLVLATQKWFPPWELPEDHELTRSALSALLTTGLRPSLACYQFCTNAAYSAGVAHVPTIGFGPSTEHLAHTVDEFVEVEQLVKAQHGYAAIALARLGSP